MKSKTTLLYLFLFTFFVHSIYGQNGILNPVSNTTVSNIAARGVLGCASGIQFPGNVITPSCTGSDETIVTNAYAGEYAKITLAAHKQYVFKSSKSTDYITITEETGGAILAEGPTPLVANSGSSAGGVVVHYFIHANSACGTENVNRTRFISCFDVCFPPTSLMLSDISSSSVIVNWTAATVEPANGYDFYFSTSSTTPTSATTPTHTNQSPFTNVMGLQPSTIYYCWVRSSCTATSKSEWVVAGSFMTLSASNNCVSGTQYPDGIISPSCNGLIQTINTDCWAGEYAVVNIVSNNQYTFTSSVNTDYITITNEDAGIVYAKGTTPLVWNSANSSGTIRYYIHANSSCLTQNSGRIRSITCGAATCAAPTNLLSSSLTVSSATLSWTVPSSAPAFGYQYFYNTTGVAPVAATIPSGSVGAGITSTGLTFLASATTYYYWVRSSCNATTQSSWVAGGSFTTLGGCNPPTGLLSSNVTVGTANLSWTAPTSIPSLGYQYYYNTTGVTPGSETNPSGSATGGLTSVGLTFLSPATTYYYWVRSNCSASVKSAWVAGNSFTTLAATGPACTYGEQYPVGTFNPACSGNLETITSGAWAGEYTVVTTLPFFRYTFQTSVATDFITITNSTGTEIYNYGTGPITWTRNVTDPNIRYYIHKDSNCGVEQVSRIRYITCNNSNCSEPNSIVTSNITANSVKYTWTTVGTPNVGFQYYYNTTGILPSSNTTPTGGNTAINVTNVTIDSLSPSTLYYVWIRSNCTIGPSNWISAGSFTTLGNVTCTAPSNFSVANITSNAVDIRFTPPVQTPTPTYQIYYATTNVAPTNASTPVNLTLPGRLNNLSGNTLYYYWIRSNCGTTQSSWAFGGSFTTAPTLICNGTSGSYGLFPSDTISPSCSGLDEEITSSTWAGEYTNINVTTGKQYTFSSSVATDFITITNAAGTVVHASGVTPLKWYSGNSSGVIRYFIHSNASCGSEQIGRTRKISCAMPLISFIGDAALGWDTDVYLSSTDGINYSINNYTLTTGGLKFRKDNSWNENWGNTAFPSGTAFQLGPNIQVVACRYNITFNIITGVYTFVSTSSQPIKPTGAATQAFCGSATVFNLTATGTNIKWYDTATGGNLLASTTPIVNGSVYYASQTNGTCESLTRLAVTATITTTALPTGASAQTFCSGATVNNLAASGTALKWYNVAQNGSALSSTVVLVTGTYYVTQTLNNCESARKAVSVTINPNVTPAFTQVAPICSGAILAALPTTSTNGITGTWSPALNNTATTTYTFTPSAGQCATTRTMVIAVNSNIIPAFTQVAPICSGAALAALPTTSTNGITGTWSPALNNTATTTYTFTPNAGQCATTRTMVIAVNSNVTPAFTQVAPICSGAVLAALPTTSTNGITGTWSPALNNTATTTYTFTPNAGQCATTRTMVIAVNSNITPAFTQVAPICSGATLAALPTTSTNGITGTWSPALNNTATTTYTFTPNAGQCATTKTMVIAVNSNVTPAFTQVAPICSGAILAALPTTSTNGITGTWSPALNNTATTTYTFTPSAGQCATTRTMVIAVNSNITPAFTQVAPICSGATLAALPTTSTNGITGTWSPALNNTATTTYTFTPNAGQCATTKTMVIAVNSNVTPAFTQVAPICSGATLTALPTTSTNGITGTWSPALNNTATTTYTFTPNAEQCAVSSTMSIIVNDNVTPAFTQVAPICSGAALTALPTTSTNGITGTWSPALNNTATTTYTFTPNAGQCATTRTMVIAVNSNVTPAFTQVASICSGAALAALPTTSTNGITGTWSPTLNNTATTTYTFTPSAGQCATTRTMVITVNENVTPAFTQVAAICSGAALAALPTTSTNGITGTWSPEINNTATSTYTFTPSAGQCAVSSTMSITVNENVTPAFTQVAAICSGAALAALPTTSTNGITGTWSPEIDNTATTTYTFTPSAGQCAVTTTMVITVNPNVTPAFAQVDSICSGAALAALPTTSTNGITGTWSPEINNTATSTYTFTPSAGQCANTTVMSIIVNETPVLEVMNNITACVSYVLPEITTGDYFTESAGTGIMLNAGDAITSSQMIYVYANNGSCFSETNFQITITDAPVIDELADVVACGSYTLPVLATNANYYTEPNGTGIILNAGDVIINSQTIYIFVEGSIALCTAESDFTVTINATPIVDELADVTTCNNYTLPVLTDGNYYTQANGVGTMLNMGDVIETSQTIYIYAANGTCTAESDFTVTINATPIVDEIADVTTCDNYTLPVLTDGNYYTQANGVGTMLNMGDVIETSQTIYIYAANGTCTAESDFTVTINTTPIIDELADVTTCDNYTLPVLTNGNYYTQANGAGTMLNMGDVIETSQTIYIYAANGSCTAESDFTVTINATPIVDELADVTTCDGYTLPTLTNGNYYTQANGAGTMLNMGDVIETSQTIYIYAANGNCTAESEFTIVINALDSSTTLSEATITANQSGASYQWISCDELPGIIVGETNQSFTATTNGNYAVIITLDDCSVTTNCVTIDTLRNDEFLLANTIKMYPNPSNGRFTVDTGNIVADTIYIFDSLGRLIVGHKPTSQLSPIDLGRYEDGVYYVKIKYQNKETTKKLILNNK